VEFALVCALLLALMLAVLEYSRLVLLWNAVQEVGRRAARAAAITDFSDAAALQALRHAALMRSGDGTLLLAPNLGPDNVVVDYLWQDTAGALAPLPVLPACPAANRVNCARAPHGSSCIRFVRVRICGSGAGCPALAYEPFAPLVPVPPALPQAATVVRAESLGYWPGMASCP